METSGSIAAFAFLLRDLARRSLVASAGTGRLARARALRPVASPPGILFAPPRLMPGDSDRAKGLYSGEWTLAGHTLRVDANGPFAQSGAPDAWVRELERFGWLADLQAAGGDLFAAHARLLIENYLSRPLFATPHGRDVGNTAERTRQWLLASPLLFRGAEHRFTVKLGRALVQHGRWLRRTVASAPEPLDRLRGRAALLALALCLGDGEKRREKAQRRLIAEMEAQLLADGGHASRDPSVLPVVLEDLLLLRQSYRHLGRAPPQPIIEAIEKSFVLLRFFDTGGGRLARFNGAGWVDPALIEALLAQDDTGGRPAGLAAASRYLRMEADGKVLVADAGGPPPLRFARHAHAGALSFEFAANGRPLIVNCGAARDPQSTVFGLSRITAAHSTLTIGERSSARFASVGRLFGEFGGRLLTGGLGVTVRREGPLAATVSHDGYAEAFGTVHERTLTLSHDGRCLNGVDRLIASPGRSFAVGGAPVTIRFHLHPDIDAWADQDGSAILSVAAGRRWRFVVDGQRVALTDSIYLGRSGGPLATRQIEITLTGVTAPIAIEWGLLYLD